MIRHIAILLLCLVALGCSGRKETAEAWAFFEQRYPYAELLDVKVSEDEVAGRSFVFTYRLAGQEQVREVAIQFVEDPSTGRWSPQPEEPRSLP